MSSVHAQGDVIEQFRVALRDAGLEPPDEIRTDGELHRFATNGKRSDTAGWYVLHVDGVAAGAFGDWRRDINATWCAKKSGMTKAERKRVAERLEEIKRLRDKDVRLRREEAASRATAIWNEAKPADASHPYLQRKKVQPHGMRTYGDALLVPVTDAGSITSLQFISPDGSKKFLLDGRTGGCFWTIPGERSDVVAVCEGFATGASIREATGCTVYLALSLNNLEPVARAVRKKHPKAQLVLCADNDATAEGNPGITKAREVAAAVGAVLAVPELGGAKCDFNDVHAAKKLDEVRHQIEQARAAASTQGAELLDDVHAFLRKFVAYPSEAAGVAHALWVAHAHAMDCFASTPRLAFLSPERGSGKTRALEVSETLVPRPLMAFNASPAYLFRRVSDEDGTPTILYDEVDALFGKRASQEHEDLRAFLNSGHRRGAMAGRCVVRGKTVETEDYPAYCAVALAGLGNLPDTILSRSVIIKMRRRSPTEHVQSYRERVHAKDGHLLRDRLEAWVLSVNDRLADAWPDMPDGIADRDADVWEALLAIADAAGGEWPSRSRVAAVALVASGREAGASLGVRLLGDLRTVFGSADGMHTQNILQALHVIEEGPWGDLKGKPLEGRGLAWLLRQYDVHSRDVRVGEVVKKGYIRTDLHDPWSRYLPPVRPAGATSATSATTCVKCLGEGCPWCETYQEDGPDQ